MMKIGVISDSHDHMDNIGKFVDIFNDEGVDVIIHCGDFCSPFVARKFNNLNKSIKFYAVRGNNDGDINHLNFTFSKLCKIVDGHQTIELAGKKFFILHGHGIPEGRIDDIARGGAYDVILYGHYHHTRDETVGDTVIMNPGESCGYLTGESTCGIIEIQDNGQITTRIVKL
ncbi:MAG: metallophosphoesterase [Promethearchaeota archaeon]